MAVPMVSSAEGVLFGGFKRLVASFRMVSSAEGVLFGGFKRLVASFRMAGVALRDIQTCFVTCRKWFCVAGAILL